MRLWVDTDVGDDPDDVVALLCAAAHPDVELVGVSTVPGVPGVPGVRPELARALVDAPVHPGEDGAAMSTRSAPPRPTPSSPSGRSPASPRSSRPASICPI